MTIGTFRGALALVLATAGIGATAGPAAAAGCGASSVRYGVTEYWTYWEYGDEESVDGPGGTVTATITKSQSKTTTIGGKVGAAAKKVFADLSAEFNGSIAWTTTIERGRSYSHDITPGMYGHLRPRVEMHDVRWVEYIDYERCADEWTGTSGSAIVASKKTGWRYWESHHGEIPAPDDGRTHTPPPKGPPNPPIEA
jgi:hypothetical protein